MTTPTVAVVICAYTMERWDDLSSSIRSASAQSPAPDELLLVVDHNELLLERAKRELVPAVAGLEVVRNARKQGLSGARNTGIESVVSDVVVFLDDDAAATDGWLAGLLAPYADSAVMAVGGSAAPRWSGAKGRPVTLPSSNVLGRGELDWVVGCTYEGQPTTIQPVRNLMGCNMSFRRQVFAETGGFDENLGRVGKTPLGCEETELCIRARQHWPDKTILFDPRAQVHHHVSRDRRSWRYLRRRAYAEGLSKAAVSRLVGAADGLETERSYASRVLPRAFVRQIRAGTRPGSPERRAALGGALAITVAFGFTAIGYVRGRLAGGAAIAGQSHVPLVLVRSGPSRDGSVVS